MTVNVILVAALAASVFASNAARAEPELHVGYDYESCYIDLHPELTADQFSAFTREFADVGAFSAMSGARTLSPWQVGIGVTYDKTFIPDEKPQWNNSFTHPGDDHYLGQPAPPRIQVKLGLPHALEGELMLTGDPNSNWAVAAAALRTTVLSEGPVFPVSMAVRLEYLHLLGAEEYDLDAVSLGGLVSRSFGRFTPYAGVDAAVAHGSEQTMELSYDSTTTLSARTVPGIRDCLVRRTRHVATEGVVDGRACNAQCDRRPELAAGFVDRIQQIAETRVHEDVARIVVNHTGDERRARVGATDRRQLRCGVDRVQLTVLVREPVPNTIDLREVATTCHRERQRRCADYGAWIRRREAANDRGILIDAEQQIAIALERRPRSQYGADRCDREWHERDLDELGAGAVERVRVPRRETAEPAMCGGNDADEG